MEHSQDNGSDSSVGFDVSMATVIKIHAPKFMVVAVNSNLRSGRVNIERFGAQKVKWAVRIGQIVNKLYVDCDGLAFKSVSICYRLWRETANPRPGFPGNPILNPI